MRHCINIIFFLGYILSFGFGQENKSLDIAYEEKISSLLDFSIPMVTIEDYKAIKEDVVLLDAREPEEYFVSHIRGALNIGYDVLDENLLAGLNHDDTIILYCSVGYRSEKMGARLVKAGFTKVYNLYGSIFQWANQGNELVDKSNIPTQKIHTYNRSWGKWLINLDLIKVY